MKKVRCPNCLTSPIIHQFNSNKFQIYFCKECLNGFTYPVPKDLSRYYGTSYWQSQGFLGMIKNGLYKFFQMRRKIWVRNFLINGELLDVGSGEGIFSKLIKKDFNVTSLDVPSSDIKNSEVIKADFLKWSPNKKFDVIVFWESLEHTQYPQKYIQKAEGILKSGGYIFIEYPNFNCWEARLFKNYWFHLDTPRHLSHLTPDGLDEILSRARLITVSRNGVFTPEYTVGGFMGSILNIFLSRQNDFFKNSQNLFFIFLLIPLIIISAIVETVFLILRQSPIYLTVAKKG